MSQLTVACAICNQSLRADHCTPARALRPSLRAFCNSTRTTPLLDTDEICRPCSMRARSKQLTEQLLKERGQLSAIELEVTAKAALHEAVATNLEAKFMGSATRGQKLADAVARVGGSWGFVTAFMGALCAWLIINSLFLGSKAFDPYPYILLNLALSCVAALQAPIIMMSQNRVSARDRMQADHDFRINLKAELEIAGLHEKLDHLLHEQWESLITLQQAQLDLLAELSEKLPNGG